MNDLCEIKITADPSNVYQITGHDRKICECLFLEPVIKL